VEETGVLVKTTDLPRAIGYEDNNIKENSCLLNTCNHGVKNENNKK